MTGDDLADLISNEAYVEQSRAVMAADAIRSRWRLASKFQCQHRDHHEIEEGETHCCGLPVVPWGEA